MTGCCTKRAAAGFVEKLPQSKPDGFASSLGEGASGETRKFAIKPETFPLRQRPPPQAHYVRQLPQGDAFALCWKPYRCHQKPSPWGRWLDAKRQDGRGIPQLPFAVTTPPVKMCLERSAGKVIACRKRAKTLRWARGREGCSDSPLPTSGLHPPRNGSRATRP